MRVAILISGEPRFCTDFDKFMNSFINYSRIDYYFYLWKTSPIELADKRWNLVADCWRNIDENWAIEKIKTNINLPNHHVMDIKFGEQDILKVPSTIHKARETNMHNVYHMHQAWINVNDLKNKQQLDQSFTYDLVINGRLDITINTLDLQAIYNQLKDKPPSVMTVLEPLYGYGPSKINDNFTIGLEPAMNTYMQIGQYTIKYNDKYSVLFHPETLLVYHLKNNEITDIKKDFGLQLRNGWKRGDPFYTSDFGRWV